MGICPSLALIGTNRGMALIDTAAYDAELVHYIMCWNFTDTCCTYQQRNGQAE